MSEWDAAWYEVMGLEDHRPTFITVNGTGSPDPFGFGFAGDVGRALSDQVWKWQPIGYPAATFPMGPSVQAGVAEVLRQIDLHPGRFGMAGYSQGALVTDIVWRDHLLSGSHTARMADCIAIVNFGDPMRAPGVCNGNVRAGFPIPKPVDGAPSGGISGTNDLTAAQTPPFLMSCNNDGDLYGAAPSGPGAGADEQLMFDFVQNVTVNNVLSIATAVIPLLNPAADIAALVAELPALLIGLIGGGVASLPSNASNAQIVGFLEALLNGGMFAFSGMGPHMAYAPFVSAMVDFVNQAGRST